MQDLNLTGEALRLFNESTPDVQAEFLRLQANKAKARELADMVGSVVVDENIPLEVLEIVADLLKEDCRQIRQAANDIKEEQQAIEKLQTAAGKES
ncbi:MAG: hypothetical protein IJF37_02010 [Lachnospiraceae bacterium]|nr:hypothetical protein [Lachnospiraceae bacterium]